MDDTLYDGTGLAPAGETSTEEPSLTVPAGSLDERLAWVSEGADAEERRARADAIWAHEVDASDGSTDLDELSRLLTYHVYREQNQAAVVVDGAEPVDMGDGAPQTDGDGTPYEGDAPSGPAADTVTDGSGAVAVPPVTDAADTDPGVADPGAPAEAQQIPGELVESDTAGTGPAVNAETGEVTQPGEQLPPVAQPTGPDSVTLDPPQTT